MNCSVHLANEETRLETTSDFLLDFPKLLKILSSNCSVCVCVCGASFCKSSRDSVTPSDNDSY